MICNLRAYTNTCGRGQTGNLAGNAGDADAWASIMPGILATLCLDTSCISFVRAFVWRDLAGKKFPGCGHLKSCISFFHCLAITQYIPILIEL